jgi:hypothetical protein
VDYWRRREYRDPRLWLSNKNESATASTENQKILRNNTQEGIGNAEVTKCEPQKNTAKTHTKAQKKKSNLMQSCKNHC